MFGGLKRGTDSRKVLDFSTARLGIEAFHVSLLTHFERSGDIYFFEIFCPDNVAGHAAQLIRWGNKCSDGNDARVHKEFGHFGYTANILPAVFSRKSEAFVDSAAYVVAIENAAKLWQRCFCLIRSVP